MVSISYLQNNERPKQQQKPVRLSMRDCSCRTYRSSCAHAKPVRLQQRCCTAGSYRSTELSTSSRFDYPLPEEEQEESIKESSNIEHVEPQRAEASLLSNQIDNLLKERQIEMFGDQEDEKLKDQY